MAEMESQLVRRLETREIYGNTLEQVVLRNVKAKKKWFLSDVQERKKQKRLIEKAQQYTGTDLEGLLDYLGPELCSGDTWITSIGELLNILRSNGCEAGTFILVRSDQPDKVEPVQIDPVDIWFEPAPVDELPEGIPGDFDDSFPEDEVESEEERRTWFSFFRDLAGIAWVLSLLLFPYLFFLGIAVLLFFWFYNAEDLEGRITSGGILIFMLFVFVKAWFSTEQQFVVPGAVVLRKTGFFSHRWRLRSFERTKCLLIVILDVDTDPYDCGTIVVSSDEGEYFSLGEGMIAAHWPSLLAAWFSPLPTQKGEKLEDLR